MEPMRSSQPILIAACVLAAATAPAAGAAKSCGEPGASFERATPQEAGLDAAKLQDAMDYATSQDSFAVRVYRRGCLVAEDRLAPTNRNQAYESYSMGKSVTAMLFGRAMEAGLISPDDPVGSLFPEADEAHGKITMRQLLTMSSGLEWNGLRDYNIFTMPDRIRDALTLKPVHTPGTFFEYAQSPVSLLAEAIGRAAGEDVQAWGQHDLMDPLGIAKGAWTWSREPAGHVFGFYGVNMRPDDFGRLGDLMRRGGTWNGRRLLSEDFMQEAIAPSRTNGCYGWLIWVNAGHPCVGPTITTRPVDDTRSYPDLPEDMYYFSGLFGQLVTIFPSQDIEIVRTGEDPGLVNFAGSSSWQHELYKKVLASVTDQTIPVPPDARDKTTSPEKPDNDYGFQTAIRNPGQYKQGLDQDPLPPAGAGRARAAQISLALPHVSRGKSRIAVRLRCPPAWPGAANPGCRGRSRLDSTKGPGVTYDVKPGASAVLRFRMSSKGLRALKKAKTAALGLSATNTDAVGGTTVSKTVTVQAPVKRRTRKRRR